MKIGFKDKNGRDLKIGQTCKTYDRTGKKWIGKIVPVNPLNINWSLIVDAGGIQYAFSANYETWINNQEYASTLEIINGS